MSWLTDWDEAAERPGRARIAIFIGFIGVGFLVEFLAGYVHQGWPKSVGVALAFAAVLSMLVEPYVARRLAGEALSHRPRDILIRQIAVAVVFVIAVVAGVTTHSVLVSGVVAAAAVAVLSIHRR